jgi:hypothetical protein
MAADELGLDELLESSARDDIDFEPLRVDVRQLSFAAAGEVARETPAARRFWSKRKIAFGAVGVLVVALSSAAVANNFDPNGLFVCHGSQDSQYLDLGQCVQTHMETIPIYYETSTGKTVTCSIGISFDNQGRETNAESLTTFVRTHDWTGIGQRIYQEAIDHPFVPGPSDSFDPEPTQSTLDDFSFSQAQHLIWDEIPVSLLPEGTSSGGTSNCNGELR